MSVLSLPGLRHALKSVTAGWEPGYQTVRTELQRLKSNTPETGVAGVEDFLTEFENCLGMADDMLKDRLASGKGLSPEKLGELETVLGFCVDAVEALALLASASDVVSDEARTQLAAPFYKLVECSTSEAVTSFPPSEKKEDVKKPAEMENVSAPVLPAASRRLKTCLLMTFGGNHFAIPILQVLEILNFRDISPLPVPHDRITGVLNLRGRTLPVFDFEKCVSAKTTGLTIERKSFAANDENRPCILVVTDGSRTFGLTVDGVNRVVEIPESGLEVYDRVIPEHVRSGGRHPVTHIVRFEDLTVLLTDVAAF